MKTADRFFMANIEGNLSRLVNVRKAMNNMKCDEFAYNRDIQEVDSINDFDFNKYFCFIKPIRSNKAIEVDSIEEAESIFKNL